jgi:signal transduction histidine kinase
LISNALKHNPSGICITITAEVVTHRYRRSYLRCTIKDNGVGVPPDLTKRLFQRYTRGDRARYIPGLGLGLYLCDRIIQAHQGRIGVNSIPGKRTTFWFTLPLQ